MHGTFRSRQYHDSCRAVWNAAAEGSACGWCMLTSDWRLAMIYQIIHAHILHVSQSVSSCIILYHPAEAWSVPGSSGTRALVRLRMCACLN